MNYVLEGGGNFNTSLMKALCEDPSNEKQHQRCLISNQILNDNAVTLICKHSFNYIPLFKEVLKQKQKINRLEIQKLKKFQIKCPYCRNIQGNILPYNNNYNNSICTDVKIIGVNWPPKYAIQPHRCKAIFKTGKKKGEICNQSCTGSFCKKHIKKNNVMPQDVRCAAILKSGKNKGKQCNYKKKENGFCGLHKK